MSKVDPIVNSVVDKKVTPENYKRLTTSHSTDIGGDVVDMGKVDDEATAIAEKYNLPTDGEAWRLLKNKIKSNTDFQIIKPQAEELFKQNYPELHAKRQKMFEDGFKYDDEIYSKVESELTSLQNQYEADAKNELNAIDAEYKSKSELLNQQYKDFTSQSEKVGAELDNLYKSGQIDRLEYENRWGLLQKEKKDYYDLYEKQFPSLDEYVKKSNEINSKYNRKFELQKKALTDKAQAQIKTEFDKYSASYKEDPAILEEINKAYRDSYELASDIRTKTMGLGAEMSSVPMSKLYQSTLSSLGGVFKGWGGSLDSKTLELLGESMEQNFMMPAARTEEFKDWLDPQNLQLLTGQLLGSMAPSMAITAAVATSTGGTGIPAIVPMITGGLAGWASETVDIVGRSYLDMFEKSGGDVAKSNKAAESSLKSQYDLMWTYSFDALPFVGGALKRIPSKLGRVAVGAGIETGTEFLQEYPQNIAEENIQKGLDPWTNLGEALQDTKKMKQTLISIGPVAILGGAGQLGSKSAKQEAVDNYVAMQQKSALYSALPDQKRQYIQNMVFDRGGKFARGVIGAMFSDGTIDEETSKDLLVQVENSERIQEAGKSAGLKGSKLNVYGFYSARAEEAEANAAKFHMDPILSESYKQQAKQYRDAGLDFMKGNNPDLLTITYADGSQAIMTPEDVNGLFSNPIALTLLNRKKISVEAYREGGQGGKALQELTERADAYKQSKKYTAPTKRGTTLEYWQGLAKRRIEQLKTQQPELSEEEKIAAIRKIENEVNASFETQMEQEKQQKRDARDIEIEQIQKQREALGVNEVDAFFSDMKPLVATMVERMEAGQAAPQSGVKAASDYLYAKYKELTAMKSDPNRMMTIAQIESIQAQIEQDLQTLAGNPPSQQTQTNDQENVQGVPSEVGVGQEPVTTQPIEVTSEEAPATGGVLQAQEEEVTTEAAPKTEEKPKPTRKSRVAKMFEVSEGEEAVPAIEQALSESGIKVQVKDDAEYNEDDRIKLGQGRGSEGMFIADDGTIILNRDKIKGEWGKTIVFHEGIHPVINIIRNTDPKRYKAIVDGLKAEAARNNDVAQAAADIATSEEYQKRGAESIEDETIVETMARVGSGKIDIDKFDPTFREKFIEFMNDIAKIFGVRRIALNSPRMEVKRLADQLNKMLNEGGKISDVVGKKNVTKFQNALAQARLTSKEIAERTESKTKAGEVQPSMELTAKKNKQEVVTYSGPASIQALRENKPEMYVSRAIELSDTHLVKGTTRKFSKTATPEQKLKWADGVYAKAKETVVSNLLFVYDNIDADVRNISKLWYDGANIIAQEMASKYGVSLEQASAVIATQSPQKPWFDNVHLAHFILDFYANNQNTIFEQSDFDYYKSKTVYGKGEVYPKQIAYLPELRKAIGKPFSELSGYDKSAMIRARFDQNYERNAPLRIPTGAIVDAKIKSPSSFSGYETIAKAVSVIQDGSSQNISANIGNAYKVRNFYNNIASPQTDGEVTIDTHAMAVAYMLPLGSSSKEVKFDEGTYSFFADAYREAAKQRGVLAREMQSITWEGARAIFPANQKTEKAKKIVKDIWADYSDGKINLQEAQDKIKAYGKDLSITDWGGYVDEILDEDKTATYIKELPLSSRGESAVGQRAEGTAGSGLPAVGKRGRKTVGQASKGIKRGSNLVKDTYYEAGLTEDKNDYVFFHVSSAPKASIMKGIDSTKYTSLRTAREEKGLQYGVASYYTRPEDGERMVGGDKYAVRVPKGKVYPIDSDPMGYGEKAEENVPQGTPFRGEAVKREIANMAKKDGYQMIVGEWAYSRTGKPAGEIPEFRADALVPLKPTAEKPTSFTSNAEKGMERIPFPSQQSEQAKQELESIASEVRDIMSSKKKFSSKEYQLADSVYMSGQVTENKYEDNEFKRDITPEEYDMMTKVLPKNMQEDAARVRGLLFGGKKKGQASKGIPRTSKEFAGNVGETINRIKAATSEDGATLNLDGTTYEDGGLVVPAGSLNVAQDEVTAEGLFDFLKDNEGNISSDIFKIGLYKFPDRPEVSYDLNIVIPREYRDVALKFGELSGQESLFDLDTFENIKTGSDGKNPRKFTAQELAEIAKDLSEGRLPKIVSKEEIDRKWGEKKMIALTKRDELGTKADREIAAYASKFLNKFGPYTKANVVQIMNMSAEEKIKLINDTFEARVKKMNPAFREPGNDFYDQSVKRRDEVLALVTKPTVQPSMVKRNSAQNKRIDDSVGFKKYFVPNIMGGVDVYTPENYLKILNEFVETGAVSGNVKPSSELSEKQFPLEFTNGITIMRLRDNDDSRDLVNEEIERVKNRIRVQPSVVKRTPSQVRQAVEDGVDAVEAAIAEGMDPQQAVDENISSQDWYGDLTPAQKEQLNEILQDEFGATASEPKATTPVGEQIASIVDNYYKLKDGDRSARAAINEILGRDPKLKYIYDNISKINKQLQDAGVITDKTDGCP